MQIGRKAPPPLFCLLVRYSARIVAHDVTSLTDISCIIKPHIGGDLAEKPPSLPYPVHGNSINFGFCGRKTPLPPSPPIQFMQIQSTLVFVAEKPSLPPSLPPLSSSCKLNQLWFSWQKSTPSLPYPVHANSINFGFCGKVEVSLGYYLYRPISH